MWGSKWSAVNRDFRDFGPQLGDSSHYSAQILMMESPVPKGLLHYE